MYKYKKKDIQRMFLVLTELFANFKGFTFYIKPSSGQWIRDIVSSELKLI